MLTVKYRSKVFHLRDTKMRYYYIALLISACGSTGPKGESSQIAVGFWSDYKPPEADYTPPEVSDPNYKIHEPSYIDPYWVNALVMENGTSIINNLLNLHDNTFSFTFPTEIPTYVPVSVLGWAPANDSVINASRRIFDGLEKVLNVNFEEVNFNNVTNVIAISQSIQANTAGISYFPNEFYKLGSDVFISKLYSDPFFLANGLTNYDYEILVHEIGHSLGLKHPFESDGNNTTILNSSEDKTNHTAMSYDDYSFSFDGTFRALDWMALTKLYGVNASYASGNDTYKFNGTDGIFIIDGAGIDTIDCKGSNLDLFVDLRPGTHSYEGNKSNFITAPNQLTISHGSEIEHVKTGSGNDTIVGNQLNNTISTSSGNDIIFAGNGIDIIDPGIGKDIIDFSEDISSQDTLIIDLVNADGADKVVYGFTQGANGDVIELKNFQSPTLKFLPLVDALHVPTGYIDNCVFRVFGNNLNNANNFNEDGILKNLKLSDSTSAIFISSNSQDTGATQSLHALTNHAGGIEIILLGQFIGNYLDIDNWTVENFLV